MARRKKRWSYVTGKKGISRVRAYAHRPSHYYIEWYEGERRVRQQVVPSTKEAAEQAADRKSDELEAASGMTVTLLRLLDTYHAEKQWSKEHRRHAEIYRQFWLDELGKDFVVSRRTLTPGLVEKTVADAAKENGWTGRTQETHLKYMRAAVRWGFRKQRWFDRDLLDGIDYPDYESESHIYSDEEIAKLADAVGKVDPRLEAAFHLVTETGRRINAVRLLQWENVNLDERLVVWPAETDKAGRIGRNRISEQTTQRLESLRNGSQWVFSGEGKRPIGGGTLTRMLHRAEEEAEVPTLQGRGFHAIKHWVVTKLYAKGWDFERIGQVTGNREWRVLADVYRRLTNQTLDEALVALTTDTTTDTRNV